MINERQLAQSDVVANNAMNRLRTASGGNSYEQELGIKIHSWLSQRVRENDTAAWLDLCCGEGRALLEVAGSFQADVHCPEVALHGVDLVNYFAPAAPRNSMVQLVEADLASWEPRQSYDLITCVHGLHYLGDKLGLIERASGWLRPQGQFLAHLDLANVQRVDGKALKLRNHFRDAGIQYSVRDHLVRCTRVDQSIVRFPLQFDGADDQAGPNYTGQPAVNSFYHPIPS